MKLQLTQPEDKYLITGHGPGYVKINDSRHLSSLIIMPDQIIEGWPVSAASTLTPEHFARVVEYRPEVLLVGTGHKLAFPAPASLRLIIEAGIGYEIMDTAAACRTYNILMSEGRNVAAALMIEPI